MLFTDKFHVDIVKFEGTGAFNLKLNVDSRFFIDPKLVGKCKEPELIACSKKITDFFQKAIICIKSSKKEGDTNWMAARSHLGRVKENNGMCLGYSKKGTAGSAMGEKTIEKLIENAKELITAGEENPLIFEILGIFTEGIGCDWSSDTVATIILPEICSYSLRIMSTLGLKSDMTYEVEDVEYNLLRNPINNEPILFVPKSILCNLPATSRNKDINYLSRSNKEVRELMNKLIPPETYRKTPSKQAVKRIILSDEGFRKLVLKEYESAEIEPYDFDRDPDKEYVESFVSKLILQRINEGALSPDHRYINNGDDVDAIVAEINNFFKEQVESKDLWKSLYSDSECKCPQPETKIQPVYRALAEVFCRHRGVDLSPGSNAGRGPVDFKYSKGWDYKVLVEVKLASNMRIEHGFKKQLPDYMLAEETKRAHYLVLDFGIGDGAKKIMNIYEGEDTGLKEKISLTIVDCTKKKSASVA